MSIKKERLNRRTSDGQYDTLHLETSSDVVLRTDGSTNIETSLSQIETGLSNGTYVKSYFDSAETTTTLPENGFVVIGDADTGALKKIAIDTFSELIGAAGTDPSVNYTALAEPHVLLSPSTGGTSTPCSDLKDGQQKMLTYYGLQRYFYKLMDATSGVTYYLASESMIGNSDTTATASYISTADPTKWYADTEFTLLNISNPPSLFTALATPTVDTATTSNAATAGSTLSTTLIEMIRTNPTWNRYALTAEGGGTTYYIITPNTITDADSGNITGVTYCTASGTYYTDATVTYYSAVPEDFPDPEQLTVGNTVTFASKQWIVSHKTATDCYLTLKALDGNTAYDAGGSAVYKGSDLANRAMTFQNGLTEGQLACLKDVTVEGVTAKVFVATKDQMDGGFSYFNSDSRRSVGSTYWTSTPYGSDDAWYVLSGGALGLGLYVPGPYGFRPSVCLDLSLLG